MFFYFKQALNDMKENKFLNSLTIITITLSVLIVSAFTLFFVNAEKILSEWRDGVRIIAYLEENFQESGLSDLEDKIMSMYGVEKVVYVSKEKALELLKSQMKNQSFLFENLENNPLPASFEIYLLSSSHNWEGLENMASKIKLMRYIDDVEYGQAWIGKFSSVFNLLRFAGVSMGGLFFMVTVFIISNTIRLALYSRRKEIEIMRFVGAEDNFIKTPFYIEGLIQGAAGGVLGIFILFCTYLLFSSNIENDLSSYMINIRFLTIDITTGIILCSMLVGWLGCYISVKQFLKI